MAEQQPILAQAAPQTKCEICGGDCPPPKQKSKPRRFCSKVCDSEWRRRVWTGNKLRAGLKPVNSFEAGHESWNKGLRGTHFSPATEFKRGHRGTRRLDVGAVTIRTDKEKPSLGKMEIPVAIYLDLSKEECASIFLSINTEQKPVPKSLAYDLFGVADKRFVDHAAVRAADIAQFLHEDEESPYFGLVKYVGESTRGGIALSTFVNAIKPLVAEKGTFDSMKVRDLKNQTSAVLAFFNVLKKWYADEWLARQNVFMHAAGITGGIDFFKLYLIPHCNAEKSYSAATMRKAMDLDRNRLIYKTEAERLGGRAMARTVKELLAARFRPANVKEEDIEFD